MVDNCEHKPKKKNTVVHCSGALIKETLRLRRRTRVSMQEPSVGDDASATVQRRGVGEGLGWGWYEQGEMHDAYEIRAKAKNFFYIPWTCCLYCVPR